MKNREPLTEGQQKVYKFLVQFLRENRYPPTIREIQSHFGYSASNTIVVYLKKLQEKGYITKESSKGSMKSRTIRLVDDVVGDYTVDTANVSEAIDNLKKRGYEIKVNEAIEFLNELNITVT